MEKYLSDAVVADFAGLVDCEANSKTVESYVAALRLMFGVKLFGPLADPVISAIAARVGKTPAQVLLAWAVQRGTALLTTPRSVARARENFDIATLPEDALDEINRIQTRQRLNEVVKTGIPGFIPQNGRT